MLKRGLRGEMPDGERPIPGHVLATCLHDTDADDSHH